MRTYNIVDRDKVVGVVQLTDELAEYFDYFSSIVRRKNLNSDALPHIYPYSFHENGLIEFGIQCSLKNG